MPSPGTLRRVFGFLPESADEIFRRFSTQTGEEPAYNAMSELHRKLSDMVKVDPYVEHAATNRFRDPTNIATNSGNRTSVQMEDLNNWAANSGGYVSGHTHDGDLVFPSTGILNASGRGYGDLELFADLLYPKKAISMIANPEEDAVSLYRFNKWMPPASTITPELRKLKQTVEDNRSDFSGLSDYLDIPLNNQGLSPEATLQTVVDPWLYRQAELGNLEYLHNENASLPDVRDIVDWFRTKGVLASTPAATAGAGALTLKKAYEDKNRTPTITKE
jgi:hypothetical protein